MKKEDYYTLNFNLKKINKMKIELDRDDIIKEIDANYTNDSDLYFDIVDKSTTSWEPVRVLVKRLIEELRRNGEIGDLDELIKE